ncbi:deoxycytidylate deaminase-like isoform X1 [Atheta coriaria]|uniref:deoxycytidylate deaminase-like isoform X1 n=1 Tax=Dalotia coriaria TaxID=877792 RepID=UPI0031F3D514
MSTPKKMKTETSDAILNSEPPVPGKREDYINWDDFFMGVAVLAAQRSKDPETQVGACVVNPEKQIVGVGYNTMPYLGDNKNNDDHEHFPWKSLGKIFTKHEYGNEGSENYAGGS